MGHVPALEAAQREHEGLRTVYERDRIAVVNAFYACNLESLRSFASAFRIRRPK